MSELGVTGNPAVFAPVTVFKSWSGKTPTSPKSFVGIVKDKSMLAFHDPELTLVYPHGNGIVFVQQISASTSLKRYLKKLPASGWKPQPGTYTTDGGEHVLFDAMYSAADYGDRDQREDIEAESGKPMRVQLAKGEYRLELLGLWKPEDDTELVAARLVPSSEPTSTLATKAASKASPASAPKSKRPPKAAKEPKLEYVDGRFPGALPPIGPESTPFLRYLHEQEAAMLEAKQPMAVWEKEIDAIDKGKRRFAAAEVHAVAATMLPIDFGKQPDNPNRSRVKSKQQWNQQNREFQALSDRRFVRERLWLSLLALLGTDPKLKREWSKHVNEVEPFYRARLVQWLKQQRVRR